LLPFIFRKRVAVAQYLNQWTLNQMTHIWFPKSHVGQRYIEKGIYHLATIAPLFQILFHLTSGHVWAHRWWTTYVQNMIMMYVSF